MVQRSKARRLKQQTDAEWKAEILRKLKDLSELRGLRKDVWRIMVALEKLAGPSEVYISLTQTPSTNTQYSHFSCQLLTSLVSLWSFLWQVSNTLFFGQRQKVDQIHFFVGRRICGRQEGLGPIFMLLLFYGGDTICLQMMSQIPLAFLFFLSCFFLQLFLLCYFCLFLGLAFKTFLFFLLSKQGFRLSMFFC